MGLLNSLITMNRKYADMPGYTQQEMETCFSGYISLFAEETGKDPKQILETLRIHYDGYRFSEKDVRVKAVAGRIYTFDYPNREVKTAFLETLFHSCTQGLKNRSRFAFLAEYLQLEDMNAFMETMTSIFASIPYTLESKRDEAYFHTIFYLMACASGVNAHSELLTCDGGIDLVMEFPDNVYIIEFKCNQSAEAALRQIWEKGYADRYRSSGKKLTLMGINFNSEKRNVADWQMEQWGIGES